MSKHSHSRRIVLLLLLLMLAGAPGASAQQARSTDVAQANNPLADIRALNLQNYYIPKLSGAADVTANTFWIRGAMPTGRVLWRASLPLQSVPNGILTTSGVGDFDVFAAYLAVQKPTLSFGIGPQLVAPTASEDALGTGKWQAGVAAVAFAAPSPKLQYGSLLIWKASVAGDEERADTSGLGIQIFGFWQLGGGRYLRGAPTWAFDLKSGNYNIPFGIGIGQVMKVEKTTFNLFIEPQFTILQNGPGQPQLQIFTALNMQFD